MAYWDNGNLKISDNNNYFLNGDKPFFWLGDTAWLIFANISEEEAYVYLKNRADKGFSVIQACLVYAVPKMADINKMPTGRYDVETSKYWEHCDRIIKMAQELGIYMALLPSWGSLLKNNIINMENASEYAEFLADRYKDYKNIIWVLGGDIKAAGYEGIYNVMGNLLKEKNSDKLIGFHPFGRCSSTQWFGDAKWLDFNMFQSGHRRYDQCEMGAWDDNGDNTSYYGEDNWKYVEHDKKLSDKPTLDAEPSYELILQGLHDASQPYWMAKDVRRYAYWSVLAGAAGHTYGDNSVMQFFTGSKNGASYGAKESWKTAIHHDGSGQMRYLKELMESVDYVNGKKADEFLIGGQKEKYERVAVFAGKDFLIAYSFLGKSFCIDTSCYIGKEIWFMKPATGVYSYEGVISGGEFEFKELPCYDDNTDIVVLIK